MTDVLTPEPVSLHYVVPPEDLRAYFGSLYIFETKAKEYSDVTRADIAQLRFMLSGAGNYYFSDGKVKATPQVCLIGPTQGATRFHLHVPALVVGISLLPLGWVSLTGRDAHHLTDDLLDMADAKPAFQTALAMLLDDGAVSAEAIAQRMWPFLRAQIAPVPQSTREFVRAVDHWLAGEESPHVEMLAEATDLSARQVARLTNRYYGAAPKQLARKYRALRCAAKIALDRQPWQELCDDATFYDQSHFIREIKHFIGLTPHQLMVAPTDVARLTLQRRELLHDTAEINRIS